METIITIGLLLSLIGNGIQHHEIKAQDVVITTQKTAIDDLVATVKQSIEVNEQNVDSVIEINTALETCVYDLQETRNLQANFERIIERASVDNKALENMLISTDWGSIPIPDDIDF